MGLSLREVVRLDEAKETVLHREIPAVYNSSLAHEHLIGLLVPAPHFAAWEERRVVLVQCDH